MPRPSADAIRDRIRELTGLEVSSNTAGEIGRLAGRANMEDIRVEITGTDSSGNTRTTSFLVEMLAI